MALRLRITGPRGASLGERGTCVFGVHGGRIGRAADNEWPLPDPERFLSGHHAAIEYRSGLWYVLDTSSNGTYLNDGTAPLGRDSVHVLKTGDRLRMGEYELAVTLSPDNDFPPDLHTITSLDGGMEAQRAMSTHGDLGAEFDVSQLISDPLEPTDDPPLRTVPVRASDAYGQSFLPPERRPETRAAVRPIPRLAGVARTDGAITGHSHAVLAFFRGAGLDPSPLSVEQAATALTLAGQLVREMALGLISSLQRRSEQKDRYRIEDTAIRPMDQNPLKIASSVDDALSRLFGPRSSRFLAPVEAVRSSFNELQRHDQATQIALQDAVADYLRRLAPDQLELQFGEALSRSGASGDPKPRYWDMYGELYRVLAQTSPEGLPHAFAEEFARAYETANAEFTERDRRPTAHTAGRTP